MLVVKCDIMTILNKSLVYPFTINLGDLYGDDGLYD